jgi:uncharacterized protein (TIGR03086 family)
MHTVFDFRQYDAIAVRASVALVDHVTLDDLERPTPCAEWDLRALLTHMTGQHHGFAAAAEGNGADQAVWRPFTSAASADPVGDYARAAERVLAAFAASDVPQRPFDLAELGLTVPGAVAISFHFIDYVVHGWDVAATLGRPYELPEDVLRAAVPVADSVPTGARRRAPGAAFAPPLEAEPDGDALAHILRFLGRSPNFNKPDLGR